MVVNLRIVGPVQASPPIDVVIGTDLYNLEEGNIFNYNNWVKYFLPKSIQIGLSSLACFAGDTTTFRHRLTLMSEWAALLVPLVGYSSFNYTFYNIGTELDYRVWQLALYCKRNNCSVRIIAIGSHRLEAEHPILLEINPEKLGTEYLAGVCAVGFSRLKRGTVYLDDPPTLEIGRDYIL